MDLMREDQRSHLFSTINQEQRNRMSRILLEWHRGFTIRQPNLRERRPETIRQPQSDQLTITTSEDSDSASEEEECEEEAPEASAVNDEHEAAHRTRQREGEQIVPNQRPTQRPRLNSTTREVTHFHVQK